jgi:HEPN domain-containing protein
MKMGKRKFGVEDGFTLQDLMQYGIDHLACAKLFFSFGHPRTYDSAGYIAHLGIELVMKALLLSVQGYFTDTHNLSGIYNCLSSKQKKWLLAKKHEKTISLLNKFYNLRYPRLNNVVEIGSDDWPHIESLLQALIKKMNKRQREEINNIDIFSKGNRVLLYREIS